MTSGAWMHAVGKQFFRAFGIDVVGAGEVCEDFGIEVG